MLLIMREMQIKLTMKYLTPYKLANINMSKTNQCGMDTKRMRILFTVVGMSTGPAFWEINIDIPQITRN